MKLTVAALKKELAERGLHKTGNKPETAGKVGGILRSGDGEK